MSELRVDSVKSKGGGAPDLPKGVTISGIATAATLGATTVDVSNVNVSGVVTSGTLSGSLLSTGTPTLGLGVTINSSGLVISGVATAGIVSATTLYGDGTNITGVGATLAPLFYQPDPYDTGVLFPAGIGITFNQQVKAGTGNVTLSIANAGVAGTVVENFGVGSSVSISENRITIDPTADLSAGGDYIISYPSGCFTNNEGTDYVGTAYTFQARAYDYQLWSWGYNDFGTLGQNNRTGYSSPIQIPGTTWASVAHGYSGLQAMATKTDGTLWTWGRNEYGQLAQNDKTHTSSPVQIPGTTWVRSHIGDGYNLANKTDGTLWAFGKNTYGTLGQNNRTFYSSPVQIPGTTWTTKAFINNAAACIRTDGTLWMWGLNNIGQLGQNNTTNRSSPVQIPGTTWAQVGGNYGHFAATKTDGTLWAWGNNEEGQLGQNNLTDYSSPKQIPGTNWSISRGAISASYSQSMHVVKQDGTLWAWGNNLPGSLGQNEGGGIAGGGTYYSSPVQIPGTTWSAVYQGPRAIKTDGTLWTWGAYQYGRLGQNSNVARSSPVQVGSDTTWYRIGGTGTAGNAWGMGVKQA